MAIEIKVNSTHLAFRNLLYSFRHNPLRYGSVFHNCRTAIYCKICVHEVANCNRKALLVKIKITRRSLFFTSLNNKINLF